MFRSISPQLLLVVSFICTPCLAEQPELSLLHEQLKTARQLGDIDKADQLAVRYLELATKQTDRIELGKAYFNLGRNAMERNTYPAAKEHLKQAISLFKGTDQRKLLADAVRQLGLTFRYQSDYATALEYLYQAMQIYQTLQDQSAIASAYNSIGIVLEKMGQYEEALKAHQQALNLHYQLGDSSSIASAIYNLGDLNRVLGDNTKALQYFLQSLELDIASGNVRNIAYSHNKLGYLYSDIGEFYKAAVHTQQALALFEQIGAPRDTDWARTVAAKLAMEQGEYLQAQQLLDGVIERAIQQQYNSLLVDAYKMASELAIRKGDDTQALSYIAAGITQAQKNNERADEAQLQKMRVEVFIRQDEVRDALTALLQQKQLEDDIFGSKRADTIAAIQAQTDFIRQQHQIENLQQQQILQQALLQKQNWSRNFWTLGLVASFVLMLLLYRRYLLRRQNQHLEQQVAARTLELKQANTELERANQQLEMISLTDKLTGLHNRHFLESHIESDLEQCRRVMQDWQSGKIAKPENADLAVFLIDLDNFKRLNDRYGHNVGDDVLKQLRHTMQQVFRHSDYLVRWGGEEFVVVARCINRDQAGSLAQRFVTAVQQIQLNTAINQPLNITCSVGYACYPLLPCDPHNHWKILLKLADICLYAAKFSGRNGWVGVQEYAAELVLSSTAVSAAQLERWHKERLLQLNHSFSDQLRWHTS